MRIGVLSTMVILVLNNKWWAKLVIQVLVEYQALNFEMAISFKLRLEYLNYAYN